MFLAFVSGLRHYRWRANVVTARAHARTSHLRKSVEPESNGLGQAGLSGAWLSRQPLHCARQIVPPPYIHMRILLPRTCTSCLHAQPHRISRFMFPESLYSSDSKWTNQCTHVVRMWMYATVATHRRRAGAYEAICAFPRMTSRAALAATPAPPPAPGRSAARQRACRRPPPGGRAGGVSGPRLPTPATTVATIAQTRAHTGYIMYACGCSPYLPLPSTHTHVERSYGARAHNRADTSNVCTTHACAN